MEKILLIDHISNIIPSDIIKEGIETSNDSMIIQGIIQKADSVNGNGRVYRRETLEREIAKYKAGPVAFGNALGELDHPDTSVVSLQNVSHRIIDIWWEGNNVMGKIEIISEHPSGQKIMALLRKKIPVGISSRGMGSVRQIGETIEVGNDFDLLCFDLVSTPSTTGAYLYPVTSNLSESLKPEPKEIIKPTKYDKVLNILSEMNEI